MKKMLMVIVLLVGVMPISSLAYYRNKTSTVDSMVKAPKQYESVQLIEGDVDKPYVRVGLVWEFHKNADKAVKKLKKQANRMGADAVIHYVIQAPSVFGWAVRWSTQEEAQEAKANEEIPTIFGKPKRSYQELGPVWSSHNNVNKAFKKLKKIARKKGADAIIEFKIGSYEGVRYTDIRHALPARWNANGLLAWDTFNSSTSTSNWNTGPYGDRMFDPQPQQFKTDTNTQISVPVRYTIPTLQGIAVKWNN